MNAKHSLSMSRAFLLFAGAVLCAQPLAGQESWSQSRNVAGLASAETSGKTAEAALFGSFSSGDFRTLSQGKTVWTAGAAAKAETHFKDLVLVGNFGFEQEEGSEMMGSMFTKPGYYPVDVLEFTPGRKSKQTYDIAGGLAWTNGSRWIPGINARFQGINYAKRKDLRHTTYRQELELTPSLLFQGDGWRIGASYIFEKTSEFIQAEQIGPAKAESYYAFLDKGMRYGSYQAWDGSGIHLAEPGVDRFPVHEISHGASLQFSLGESLYADVEFLRSQGEVGEKGYTWFRFPSLQLAGQVIYSFEGVGGSQSVRLSGSWSSQQMEETVIEKVTSGGVTTPSILGSNRVFAKKALQLQAVYTIKQANGFALEAGMDYDRDNKLSSTMYPFLDFDRGSHIFLHLDLSLPLTASLTLKAGGLVGGLLDARQNFSENENEKLGVSSRPFQLSSWWNLEQEYDDILRAAVSLALRYDLRRLPLYLEAGCNFTYAFGVTLVPGPYRQCSQLCIGYKF